MEKLFMSAGIVAAIVLLFVGIIKLPFKKFKETHAKWYKAVFTITSLFLSVGLSVVNELYILCGELLSFDFVILVCAVMAGVFCGYGGVYEGLGIKELVKRLTEKVKEALELSAHKKAVKYLNKIEDVEAAIKILEERKENTTTTEV